MMTDISCHKVSRAEPSYNSNTQALRIQFEAETIDGGAGGGFGALLFAADGKGDYLKAIADAIRAVNARFPTGADLLRGG